MQLSAPLLTLGARGLWEISAVGLSIRTAGWVTSPAGRCLWKMRHPAPGGDSLGNVLLGIWVSRRVGIAGGRGGAGRSLGGAARQWPSPLEGTFISIASAPLGAALPRNPSRGRPRSAGAAEWACGSRPLPSGVRPPLSLLLQLLLPPRPGLRRPPPSATPAVNERPAPPGAGCRRRGLPGGTRPAKMYGKEGSASGLANLQNEDHCPPAGPRRGQGCGLGARLGSFCRSVCASVLGGQRCSGPGAVGSSRSFGPSCLRALGRVGGGPSGCGGLGGSEAAGFWGKRVSLGA